MWQYESFSNEGKNPAGKNIIRVFISKNEIQECFFLEYFDIPDELKIQEDAFGYINSKNQYELSLEDNI